MEFKIKQNPFRLKIQRGFVYGLIAQILSLCDFCVQLLISILLFRTCFSVIRAHQLIIYS